MNLTKQPCPESVEALVLATQGERLFSGTGLEVINTSLQRINSECSYKF